MSIVIRTLGQESVTVNGEPVHWPSRAARDLFYLLLTRPRGYTRDQIVEWLWNSSQTLEHGGNFKVTLHRLRQALGDGQATVEHDELYRLADRYHQASDHVLFQQGLQRARGTERREQRLQVTYQALSLYAGDFLPDRTAEWLDETREALRSAYVRARLETAQLHCGALECHSAVRSLAGALMTDPLSGEQYHRNLMGCLCMVGKPDEAVTHYRHFLGFIQRDIGDMPARETVLMAEQIRGGEPHTARQIGGPQLCPRRVLYGPAPLEPPPTPMPDLSRWDTELQRGRKLLKLMQRLNGARDWADLQATVRTFIQDQLETSSVWLIGRSERAHGAHELTPPGPEWPPALLETVRWTLERLWSTGTPDDGSRPEHGGHVTVEVVGDPGQPPRAWLAVASPAGHPAPEVGDMELIRRVAAALGLVLAQARWQTPAAGRTEASRSVRPARRPR